MKTKKDSSLSGLTLEELTTRRKKALGAIIGLGIVMLAASAFLVYRAITGGKPLLIAVASGTLITFLPLLVSLGQLDKEIKLRTQSGGIS